MPCLLPDMVAALHEAAVQLGMERDALLSGIDCSVVSSIPIRQTLAAQLLTDLNELNSIGRSPMVPTRCEIG